MKKSCCVYEKENGKEVVRYFDKEGNELFEGDSVRYESGRVEKLYLTEKGELGTDATNPALIESGRAVECEYGIYPLNYMDLQEIVKVQ